MEDSKAVAAFRAVAVDAATIMTTTVAVVKVTTTEIKARKYYGGPSQGSYYQGNGGGNNYCVYPPSVQPGQQGSVTGASFHNAPVPSTVMIPMQMPPSAAPG